MNLNSKLKTIGISLAAFLSFGASGGADAPSAPSPYAPFQFLIGEWSISPEGGGPVVGVARFRWGPNQSYIWYSNSFLVDGAERPHFEGLLVWNGVHRNLDMLIAMDLEHGLVQERGTMSIDADGTVVREITASYSEGARPIGLPVAGRDGTTVRFRQTFRRASADRVLTGAMRESGSGWVATFPGSDHLVMTKRPAGAS